MQVQVNNLTMEINEVDNMLQEQSMIKARLQIELEELDKQLATDKCVGY